MSENLNLVRSIYATWERGDYSSTEWADPEIEMVSISDLFEGRAVGIAQLAAVWGDIISPLEGFHVWAREFREPDEDCVVALAEWSGRGKATGLSVLREGTHVFHIRRGKVFKLDLYESRERAFADLVREA